MVSSAKQELHTTQRGCPMASIQGLAPVAETALAQRQLLGGKVSPQSDAQAPAAPHQAGKRGSIQLIQAVLLCSCAGGRRLVCCCPISLAFLLA